MNRKKRSSALDWFADFSVHSLLLHPFSLFVAATAVILIGSSALWKQHREQIAAERFKLTSDKIVINDQPVWIKGDLRQVVYEGNRLDDWSLLDGEIVGKVRDAFSVDPWIEEVIEVEKTAQQISVTVKYREPVAMVEFGKKHLLPIDRNGIILDGHDFEPSQVSEYLRITVPNPVGGQIVTGQKWPDARVVEAAKIAQAWQGQWKDAGIFRIVNLSPPTQDLNQVGPFQLWSANQAKMIWGNPPGREVRQEASADKKIAAILKDVQQNGDLEKRSGVLLDVRAGRVQPSRSTMRPVSHSKSVEQK